MPAITTSVVLASHAKGTAMTGPILSAMAAIVNRAFQAGVLTKTVTPKATTAIHIVPILLQAYQRTCPWQVQRHGQLGVRLAGSAS
jgi:hypothetical protein